MDITTVLVSLLTLLAGAAVGYLVARGGSVTAVAERDAARADGERLRAERDTVDARARAAEANCASLRATLEHQQRGAADQAAEVQRTIDALKDTFGELSATALARNNEQFVTLAQQHLKIATTEASGDLAQRQQAISALVDPLTQTLGKVESQLQAVEKDRLSAYAAIREQVASVRQTSEGLRTETAALVTALRKPQVRGQWGEMQLRRAAEIAGMLKHCDFDEQVTVAGPDGSQRLDMVVRLAGGKNVVVDAKVSLAAFLEAVETGDEAVREERLAAHARHLRAHVDGLAAKTYWERLPHSPEFVVMFIPGESFLAPALEKAPDLQEYAARKNVLIVTPTVLIGLLRTIDFAWRQERLAENAREVFELGRDLHGRLATMGEHVTKLGRALNSTVGAYNKTVGSLESRVLSTARRMVDLNVTDTVLEVPAQIDAVAREPQAPELVASADQALVELRKWELEQQPARRRDDGEPEQQRRHASGA